MNDELTNVLQFAQWELLYLFCTPFAFSLGAGISLLVLTVGQLKPPTEDELANNGKIPYFWIFGRFFLAYCFGFVFACLLFGVFESNKETFMRVMGVSALLGGSAIQLWKAQVKIAFSKVNSEATKAIDEL